MMNGVMIVLFLVISFNSISAEMEVVLSGNRYDGISRTPKNDFLVATADDGTVIRFDGQGNSSILYTSGTYILSAFEDRDEHVYISVPGSNFLVKDYFNGPQFVFRSSQTRITDPAYIVEAPNNNLYVGSLDDGTITEILKLGPFVSVVLPPGEISNSRALTFDDDNNLYIGNTETAEIFRMNSDREFELFASLPINTGSMRIGHMVFHDNVIYVAGFEDNRIYRISLEGIVDIVAGPGASGEAGAFIFDGPLGLTSGINPYEIYVTNYNSRVINRVQLDEPLAPQAITESAGLSGLWFDPTLDGEGYNLITTASGLLMYYYGYDNLGERIWLISDIFSEQLSFNQPIMLTLFEANGGIFAMPLPSSEALTQWGTIKLTFHDCLTGLFELEGVDGVKNANVQQLAKINGTSCQ